MSSLSRQQSAQSTLSWWSDRNLPGATMDLHAASKPLMKFLYPRQALAFIETNRDSPLSAEILDIYSSYLGFKYIAPSTKIAILMELCNRVSQSADEARAVVNSVVFNQAAELLESPEPQIRRLMCRMVGRLTYHIPTTSEASPCVKLISLLSDKDAGVAAAAMQALGQIAKSPGGAQATVDANILDHIAEWVKSPNPGIRQFPCSMVRQLARQKSTAGAVLAPKPCLKLVSLLRDEDMGVVVEAIQTLCSLTKWPDGAQAVMDANMLDHVAKLFTALCRT